MPTRLRDLPSLLIVLNGIIGALQLAVAREPVCSASAIHPAFPPVNATPAVEVADADDAAPPTGANCFADGNKGRNLDHRFINAADCAEPGSHHPAIWCDF